MRRSLVSGSKLCLALIMAMVVSACDQTTAKKPAPVTLTATIRPNDALPAFADWRAAYLGGDGRVHAVTLDGKTDVVGPALPGLTSPYLDFSSGGISPNGHFVTYAPPSLTIVDLTGQHATIIQGRALAYEIFWFSDGNRLALNEGQGILAIASSQDGMPHLIQGSPPNTVGDLLGWIDSTHLAITDISGQTLVTLPNGDQYVTSMSVAALDITTGQVRVIATIRSPGLGQWLFTLSPDGNKILFSNRRYRTYPYTPLVDEIDMTSGVVTPLPNIDQATGSGFTGIAWQKGTGVVAVSSGFLVNNNLKNWLLDLGHDQAQPLPNTGYVAGWVPDNNTLALTTGQQIENGTGPFTLTALAVGANGQVASSTPLTQSAMTFPFLGFMRTA